MIYKNWSYMCVIHGWMDVCAYHAHQFIFCSSCVVDYAGYLSSFLVHVKYTVSRHITLCYTEQF